MQNWRQSVPMLTSLSYGFLASDFYMREFTRFGHCHRYAQRSKHQSLGHLDGMLGRDGAYCDVRSVEL